MSRKTLLSLGVGVLASLTSASAISDLPITFGDPLPGLTAAQLAKFAAGKVEFSAVEAVDEGLGPVFNEASCKTCHLGPGTAVGGTNQRLETRFGKTTNGVFDPLVNRGGSLLQDQGIGLVADNYVYKAEQVPPEANTVARRRTTPLFGLGLVDAVPDGAFQLLAALEAARGDGTGGKVHMVNDLSRPGMKAVGKFGWKAQVNSLFVFSGDAYLNEMGITNPLFPNESCPQGDCAALAHNPFPTMNDLGSGVAAFNDFMTLLAPPPRGPIGGNEIVGEAIFVAIGCSACHTPVLVTGQSPIAALRLKAFQPFSDFLLHDMGSLGDGIVQGDARARDMRTAPLWGLRTQTRLLHDGRATTIEQAIQAHEGQGAAARNRFRALPTDSRARLMAFLNSL
jgi:CxxC motif-containing protein (DUF1111 family)